MYGSQLGHHVERASNAWLIAHLAADRQTLARQ
jgi:hypothetical protein